MNETFAEKAIRLGYVIEINQWTGRTRSGINHILWQLDTTLPDGHAQNIDDLEYSKMHICSESTFQAILARSDQAETLYFFEETTTPTTIAAAKCSCDFYSRILASGCKCGGQ